MFDEPRTLSEVDPAIVLAVFGTLAAAAVAYALVMAARLRDPVPLLVCLGAAICALNEPIYDILGKITYADDHTVAYSAFGRDIPVFLVVGYIPWVGLLPWLIARRMAAGVSRRSLHLVALASFLSVVVVETLGTSLDAWTYYGEPPIKYLGVAPQMAAVPLLGALLLYALDPWATGRRRAVLLVPPLLALPAVYASASFPMYVANYADVAPIVRWLAAAASLGLCVAICLATTAAYARWRRRSTGIRAAGLTVDAAALQRERAVAGSSRSAVEP